VDNPKTVDPATKKESWAIQPGTMASLLIDLSAPAAKPAAPAPAGKAGTKAAPVTAVSRPETGYAGKISRDERRPTATCLPRRP
jgi:hypothetical protein